MGICISSIKAIFEGKERKSSKLYVTVFPSPFVESQIDAVFARHDEKFYFIPNEDQIDQAIEYLDEDGPNEANYQHLTSLLQQLKQLQKKYNPSVQNLPQSGKQTHDSPTIEEENEVPESVDDNGERMNNYSNETGVKSVELNINGASELKQIDVSTKIVQDKQPIQITAFEKKQIQEGELILEVQAAKFIHQDFLNKNNLQKPYVVVKFYRYQHTAKYLDRKSVV